jgi:hypothetical protein
VIKALPALCYLMNQKDVVKWIEVKARTLAQQPAVQELLHSSLPEQQQLSWLN